MTAPLSDITPDPKGVMPNMPDPLLGDDKSPHNSVADESGDKILRYPGRSGQSSETILIGQEWRYAGDPHTRRIVGFGTVPGSGAEAFRVQHEGWASWEPEWLIRSGVLVAQEALDA
jgi:hypothetical protein